MSDNQIIAAIRNSRKLTKLFNKMSMEQRRELMRQLDGDTWHILEVMEEILEDK